MGHLIWNGNHSGEDSVLETSHEMKQYDKESNLQDSSALPVVTHEVSMHAQQEASSFVETDAYATLKAALSELKAEFGEDKKDASSTGSDRISEKELTHGLHQAQQFRRGQPELNEKPKGMSGGAYDFFIKARDTLITEAPKFRGGVGNQIASLVAVGVGEDSCILKFLFKCSLWTMRMTIHTSQGVAAQS